MKRIFSILLLVLTLTLTGCGQMTPSSAGGAASQNSQPDQSKTAPAQSTASPEIVNAAGEIKTFTVTPAEGWSFLTTASNDTFKSYNLLEPYVGSANFWVRYVGNNVFDGEEKSARAAVEQLGFAEYEFVGVDKMEYEMPTVRCIINAAVMGQKFTLGHYFIDAPGDQDIYFQLSAAPGDFSKAQPLWENALKTLTVE